MEYEEALEEDDGKGADFVWHAMRKAFDPETNTVRDLKIDDGDLPLAKNYYDFCTNIAGKAIKSPFARQLWIAYNLLSEFCPRCTPAKYSDLNNIPVDMDAKDLARKVTLLVKGKCPKCRVTKSQLILNKELVDYNQLVMIAGQRGGKSAFSATITGYHTHLVLKAPRLSTMCRGIQDFTPLTGTFVALTTGRAIKLLWNPFHTLVSSSEWFCVDEDTPISMADGTEKPIKAVSVGDSVSTLDGESVVDQVFENGVKECKTVTLENGMSITGTDEHQVRCLSEDGTELLWKSISELTEKDFVVIEHE